jgi:hypothetical protein
MENLENASGTLKKLIDLPKPIVKDLKKLALEADKSLKKYIEDVIVQEVEKRRQDGDSDRSSVSGNQ